MDVEPRLRDLARGQGGVFAAADARRCGADAVLLHRLVSRGEVVRVRRGAFVLAEALTAAGPDERYRLHVKAVMRSRSCGDAASHHAALAIHRLPLYGVDTGTVDVDTLVSRVRVRTGLRTHPPAASGVELVEGTRAVVVPTALVQTAAASGVVAGVCAMDRAVHEGRCGVDELTTAVELLAEPHRRAARTAIAAIDPRTESVGESRTRLLLTDLGFRVRTQFAVVAGSAFLGRVDFLVDDVVVVEFDGMVKYEGADGKAALAAEKQRESRIRVARARALRRRAAR